MAGDAYPYWWSLRLYGSPQTNTQPYHYRRGKGVHYVQESTAGVLQMPEARSPCTKVWITLIHQVYNDSKTSNTNINGESEDGEGEDSSDDRDEESSKDGRSEEEDDDSDDGKLVIVETQMEYTVSMDTASGSSEAASRKQEHSTDDDTKKQDPEWVVALTSSHGNKNWNVQVQWHIQPRKTDTLHCLMKTRTTNNWSKTIFNDVFEIENPSFHHHGSIYNFYCNGLRNKSKIENVFHYLIRVSLILFVCKRHGGMTILLTLLKIRVKFSVLILMTLTQSIGVWVSLFYSDVILIAMSYLLSLIC